MIRIGRLAVVEGEMLEGRMGTISLRANDPGPEETCGVDWRQRSALTGSVGRITHRAPDGGLSGVEWRDAVVGTFGYFSEAVLTEPAAGKLNRYAARGALPEP